MSHKAVEVSFGVGLFWRYYYSLYLLFVFWWGILLSNLYLATSCLWIIGWCYLTHVNKLLVQFVWRPLALGWEGSLIVTPKSSLSKTRFRHFLKAFCRTRKGFEKLNDIYQWQSLWAWVRHKMLKYFLTILFWVGVYHWGYSWCWEYINTSVL